MGDQQQILIVVCFLNFLNLASIVVEFEVEWLGGSCGTLAESQEHGFDIERKR